MRSAAEETGNKKCKENWVWERKFGEHSDADLKLRNLCVALHLRLHSAPATCEKTQFCNRYSSVVAEVCGAV